MAFWDALTHQLARALMLRDRRTPHVREAAGAKVIVKVYNSVEEYNKDVQRMIAEGWTVHYQPMRGESKIHVGLSAARAVLTSSPTLSKWSKRPREITITYTRPD